MGMKTNQKITYLQTRKAYPGKLVQIKEKKVIAECTSVEGMLKRIVKRVGEYEKKPTYQYQFVLEDNEELFALQFSGESFSSQSIFSRLANANLDKPIEIGVYEMDNGYHSTASVLRQFGKTIAFVEGFIQPEKATLGGKTIYDWTLVMNAEDEIMNEINNKLGANTPIETVQEPVSAEEEAEIPF